MIGSKAYEAGLGRAALFAYAAGATGILANLLLIGFYALQVGRPENGTWLGSANDLVGSLGTAFMIPVALSLSEWLHERLFYQIIQVLGLSAMTALVVGGPLLVLGVLDFRVQAPIAIGAWMVLSLWLFLVNRWLRSSGDLPPLTARFGESMGALALIGGAIAVLALLLPWMSLPQMVLFVAGGVLAATGMIGTPFWFLLLGRHFGRS